MSIRIMMVDSDINHLEAVEKYFSNSSSIEVVKTCNNKEEVLKNLESDYDVLILNMLLSGNDSLYVLAKLRELKLKKLVIVTSEFMSSDMIDEITKYEPNYFVKKPYSMESLESILTSLSSKIVNGNNKDLKLKITNLLHSLGIPSHIKGFSYIRDSIELMYNNKGYMNAITKELYPAIAKSYETTSSRVERAIRHAIEVSWMRGDYDLMDEIFGNSVDFDRSKPTNSEFIVTLADRLKLQN